MGYVVSRWCEAPSLTAAHGTRLTSVGVGRGGQWGRLDTRPLQQPAAVHSYHADGMLQRVILDQPATSTVLSLKSSS